MTLKRYLKYAKPYKMAFILAPVLMLTEVLGDVLMPKLMSLIINNGVADRDMGYIIRMGLVMLFVAFVMAIGGIGAAYFSSKASVSFTADLRTDLFSKVQEFSFKKSFFQGSGIFF